MQGKLQAIKGLLGMGSPGEQSARLRASPGGAVERPERKGMSRIRRTLAALFTILALAVVTAPVAAANPSPPTEGGNGAGKSGQCTGANAERPASCKSLGGPGTP